MNEQETLELIQRGEGQRTEFKSAEVDAADLAKAISALSNSGGGALLLGVDDDGSVPGLWYAQPAHLRRTVRTLPDLASWRQFVVNVSRNNCDPAVPIRVEHVSVGDRDVLAIQIPDGQDKPYRANGRVYVRIDREVHDATREEIARMLSESGRLRYEQLSVPDSRLDDLDHALIRSHLEVFRRVVYPADVTQREQLLINLGYATRNGGRIVPTVAGLLLFGQQPQDRMTSATLKCAFFYGKHVGAQLRDRADIDGPISRLIDDGAAFVGRNRRLVPKMEGVRRIDVPEYPEFSVREAIANALAHRDWSLDGAKVRLFMFDDRLEIWSPGKLPPAMTLERLGFDQFSRNRLIARTMVERGLIEEIGLGIRRIREEMADLGLPAPEFREDGFSFVTTLRSIAPRGDRAISADLFLQLLSSGVISERQYRGLEFLLTRHEIQRREYVQLTGASERTALRDLSDLVNKDLVELTGGPRRSAAYKLK